MSEQENKEAIETSGNLAKPETSKEENQANNDQPENSSAVHIEPSESHDQESETDNQTGDPGRTPGKAEG